MEGTRVVGYSIPEAFANHTFPPFLFYSVPLFLFQSKDRESLAHHQVKGEGADFWTGPGRINRGKQQLFLQRPFQHTVPATAESIITVTIVGTPDLCHAKALAMWLV